MRTLRIMSLIATLNPRINPKRLVASSELLEILRAEIPPAYCPTCEHATSAPCKDEKGLWTWACFDGCNP